MLVEMREKLIAIIENWAEPRKLGPDCIFNQFPQPGKPFFSGERTAIALSLTLEKASLHSDNISDRWWGFVLTSGRSYFRIHNTYSRLLAVNKAITWFWLAWYCLSLLLLCSGGAGLVTNVCQDVWCVVIEETYVERTVFCSFSYLRPPDVGSK